MLKLVNCTLSNYKDFDILIRVTSNKKHFFEVNVYYRTLISIHITLPFGQTSNFDHVYD